MPKSHVQTSSRMKRCKAMQPPTYTSRLPGKGRQKGRTGKPFQTHTRTVFLGPDPPPLDRFRLHTPVAVHGHPTACCPQINWLAALEALVGTPQQPRQRPFVDARHPKYPQVREQKLIDQSVLWLISSPPQLPAPLTHTPTPQYHHPASQPV